MTGYTHHTSEHTALADVRAARDGDTSRHRRVIANMNVVAYLNLVIEAHAIAYDRVVDRSTVYGCTRTNLDIIVRGTPRRAEVVRMPFAPHRYRRG